MPSTFFGDAEVVLFQPGDELPVLGCDQNIHIDQGHVHFDRIVGHALHLLRLFRGRKRRLLFLLWNYIRPGVVLWASGGRRRLLGLLAIGR